ncbi:MAG: 1-deoxy-D-xylulose-5-phosphate reductoisomerase [Clostridia bacterium]|nr:1-deoxy-D-xylulose-5-phosphate reductoisomerase [Clostridia bacterium]
MKDLIILGSTGSIGTQALEVAKKLNINITGLAAGKNYKLLEKQAREFKPKSVAMFDTEAANKLKIALADTDIAVFGGKNGVNQVATGEGDTVLCSIVGIAGLESTLMAIDAGKDIALANKETLVTGGDLVKKRIKEKNVKLLPVDSEHSAIFQSLQGVPENSLNKILLTASGGPFFGKKAEDLKNVTVADALNHPNWSMGNKITIDSATLMNKGLEVIEAVHLFDVSPNQIEILVHKQSILHSAVELSDGAVIAQLGTPDMRLPIQYAFTYPDRGIKFEQLSLSQIGSLTFEKPDFDTFKCLPACIEAINRGGLSPAMVNGANEEAVSLFLNEKIRFLQIGELVEQTLQFAPDKKDFTLEDVYNADALARETVRKLVKG